MKEVFLISGKRTPMGAFGGSLSSLTAINLGSEAIKGTLADFDEVINDIEAVVIGNVLNAGLGQAPARQAALESGLNINVCATTVNKVCASGMKAISMIANDIALGNIDLGIAGGMESMSNVPHYISGARSGLSYGNKTLVDGLAHDGLTDAYSHKAMGCSGDLTASKYDISRENQDEYATNSFKKAAEAWASKIYENEVVSIKTIVKKTENFITEDETFRKVNFEKIPTLKPVFSENGTVTAANASPISDGASALLLASSDLVKRKNLNPLAKIIAYSEAEHEPDFFTTAPIKAVEKILKKTGLTINDISFFEINEAFAVVPLAFIKHFDLSPLKVNILGGAIALGHPLGSSGSRIVLTLNTVLKHTKSKYGIAAICNGGGGASAILIENLDLI